MKNTQAKRIIDKFGGMKRLVEIFHELKMPITLTTVYRWTYPLGVNNGTGGLIPTAAIPQILYAAKKKNIPLTSEDLDPRSF